MRKGQVSGKIFFKKFRSSFIVFRTEKSVGSEKTHLKKKIYFFLTYHGDGTETPWIQVFKGLFLNIRG